LVYPTTTHSVELACRTLYECALATGKFSSLALVFGMFLGDQPKRIASLTDNVFLLKHQTDKLKRRWRDHTGKDHIIQPASV
jgi:hypothetical protein